MGVWIKSCAARDFVQRHQRDDKRDTVSRHAGVECDDFEQTGLVGVVALGGSAGLRGDGHV